jgi:hypothetical protein
MRRCIVFALAVVFVAACDSTHVASPATFEAPRQGKVLLLVNVTGEPQLGPQGYGIRFDGKSWGTIPANVETEAILYEGKHVVEFIGPEAPVPEVLIPPLISAPAPAWCLGVTAPSWTVLISHQSRMRVTYTVDCPPLAGSGRIEVTVAATGESARSDFEVTATRILGPFFAISRAMKANVAVEMEVPVGVYEFWISSQTCHFPPLTRLFGFGFPDALVRPGKSASARLEVSCD